MPAKIWRKEVLVSGYATELIGISATSFHGLNAGKQMSWCTIHANSPVFFSGPTSDPWQDGTKFVVLFIPGNPGVAAYYKNQIQLLHWFVHNPNLSLWNATASGGFKAPCMRFIWCVFLHVVLWGGKFLYSAFHI